MFRRLITQMGLPAIAGLSLLLAGGPAKASEQGWPILGRNWSYYGTSYPTPTGSSAAEYYATYPAAFGGYAPEYYAAYRYSYGSYLPQYYATYQTWIPQPGGYYGSNYNWSPTTQGYYGSTGSESYYATSTAASPRERPILVNLRVPGDAKIWFDGSPTNQTGTMRSFESPPVAARRDFVYDIRIQWNHNGKGITQTRRVNVRAGDVINLTMGAGAGSAQTP
jgi:uncharacterized protein (TIGR03000 family)